MCRMKRTAVLYFTVNIYICVTLLNLLLCEKLLHGHATLGVNDFYNLLPEDERTDICPDLEVLDVGY